MYDKKIADNHIWIRLPAILKQLREWHLGYLKTNKDNQDK